jgi:hypothetical protein
VALGGSSGNTAEALDWLGKPVSCRDCPHEDIRSGAHCDLGRVCVQDRRAKRIDRFFAANPGQAPNYLRHPYFEVRALAAKYVSVFLLPPLLDDPGLTCGRWWRAPPPVSRIAHLGHPDHSTLVVAQRVDGADLVRLLRDADYWVRRAVKRAGAVWCSPCAMSSASPAQVARRTRQGAPGDDGDRDRWCASPWPSAWTPPPCRAGGREDLRVATRSRIAAMRRRWHD